MFAHVWTLLVTASLLGLVTQNNPWLQRGYDGIRAASKRFSGIVGDAAHALRGGYHIAYVLQQWWSNYSTTLPTDQGGDRSKSSGLDIGFNTGEMILHTQRAFHAMMLKLAAFITVREWNGTLDGQTTRNYDRHLMGQNYEPDATHLWHNHGGFDRSTWTDDAAAPAAVAGFIAVMNGDPLTTATTEPPDALAVPVIQEETVNFTLDPGEERTVAVPLQANYCTLVVADPTRDGRLRVEAVGGPQARFLGGSLDAASAQLIPRRRPLVWRGKDKDGKAVFSYALFPIIRFKNTGPVQVGVDIGREV